MEAKPMASTGTPDASVIVVVHNDEQHLADAIASAREQTLQDIEIVVVDDCSDDGSHDLALRLAAEDPRISVHRTPTNSGGPGGPRNLGLTVARAPWVTFLDSDDALDPTALERLLAAARQDAADVACGQIERRFLATGEVIAWREELFERRRHLYSISEFLDLVLDAANGKLFRREFLDAHAIRYTEGVAYEELVFSAQVYAAAESISVVPGRAYIWNVYPADDRKSISNRREEAINLQHRIEAFRRVLEIARGSGRKGLVERYQLKFLEHDAKLYLKDVVNLDDDEAARVLAMLDPEIRQIPEALFEELSVQDRLLYGLALSGSVAGVREIKPAVKEHVLLEGRTLVEDGRTLWRPSTTLAEPRAGTLEHRLLDITGDPILDVGLADMAFAHRVTAVEALGPDALRIRGVTTDPLGVLSNAGGAVHARARAGMESAGLEYAWPVVLTASGDQRFEWEFVLGWPKGLPYVRPMRLELELVLEANGVENCSAMWLHKGAEVPRLMPPRGSLRSVLREWFALSRVGAGRLTLRLSDPHGRRGGLDLLVHRLAGRGDGTARR